MEQKKANITFRGWAGHFIGVSRCRFRLNTLVELGDVKIVVSTVGLMESLDSRREGRQKFEEIGCGRHFETMAFVASLQDGFWDADVSRQVYFESPWAYASLEMESAANDGHYVVVNEIAARLEAGEKFEAREW